MATIQKTTLRQNVKDGDRKWFIIDAEGKTLGQIATDVAVVLRGKHRVDFTPHVDGGDHVIILNADKVGVTGDKENRKLYYRHSGYLGNLKVQALGDVRTKTPERILEQAVSGMLPKTKLRKPQLRRLHLVVGGAENPHSAQKPEPLPTNI
jgi:large subunit ribosomal protein L13